MEFIKYGILHKESNELLGLSKEYNGNDRYACGEYTWELDTDNDKPYLKDKLEDISNVLICSPEWYNSCEKRPMWNFERDELQVVKVKTVIESIDVELPIYIEDDIVDKINDDYVINRSFSEFSKLIGKNIYVNPYEKKKLVKVYELSKEYVDIYRRENKIDNDDFCELVLK